MLSEESFFSGYTKYGYSGQSVRVCWEHSMETDVIYDLRVTHYERNQIVVFKKGIEDPFYSFTIPGTGHYYVEVRACKKSDPLICSAWVSPALDETVGYTGSCSDVEKVATNMWWLFAWPAPPSFPEE